MQYGLSEAQPDLRRGRHIEVWGILEQPLVKQREWDLKPIMLAHLWAIFQVIPQPLF